MIKNNEILTKHLHIYDNICIIEWIDNKGYNMWTYNNHKLVDKSLWKI